MLDNIEVNNTEESVNYVVPMTYKQGVYYYGSKNFAKVVDLLLRSAASKTDRGKSIEDIIEPRKEYGRAGEDRAVDESGIPEGLSYLKIRDYLKEKPKAYCVARAIQLLSPTLTDGLPKGIPFESDICFYDNPPPYMKNVVPMYGNPITTNAPGLRALNQLFFDMIDGSVPKMSVTTRPRYEEFINLMQSIFSPNAPYKAPATLDKVQSYPLTGCEAIKNKRVFLTTQNSIREVQKTTAALLNYQMTHTAKVMKFMGRLFILKQNGVIQGINPEILKGGIPMVNRLSEEARNLLTEYYKYCEGTYRLGALKVLAAEKKNILDRTL